MYTKNGLIINFDISNINSYNDNLNKEIVSLNTYKNQLLNNVNLRNYGLTQYDIGKADSLTANKVYSTTTDNYYTLSPIKRNDENGNEVPNEFEITLLESGYYGKYFFSNGGYLNNPFKFHNYNIEYIPRQFKNGFTFETTLLINDNTFKDVDHNSNIFLYYGIRAEDKFANTYSGNTQYITDNNSTLDNSYYIYDVSKINENTQNIEEIKTFLKTESIYIKNNNQKEFTLKYLNTEDFTIILNKNKLTKDIDYTFDIKQNLLTLINDVSVDDNLSVNYYQNIDDVNLINININDIDNKKINQSMGLNNNVLAFRYNEQGKIGYRKINENGDIEENYSDNIAAYIGWNHITITFQPYNNNIEDVDDDCQINPRKGKLLIYVNNLLFYKNEDFTEPALNPLPIDKSKQIGLPYNISWGGGSFGLKNSYNFNNVDTDIPYDKNINNNNLLIEQNFDGYFKGGFQKLRIYQKPLNLSEMKVNYKFESEFYGIKYNKGGRIVYVNDIIL